MFIYSSVLHTETVYIEKRIQRANWDDDRYKAKEYKNSWRTWKSLESLSMSILYIKIYSFLFVEMKSCDLRNECKTEFRFIQCIHFSQTQHFSLIYIFIKAQSLAYRLAIYGVYKTLCRGTHMSLQREHLKYVQYHRNYARIRAVLWGCHAFGMRRGFQVISMQASKIAMNEILT